MVIHWLIPGNFKSLEDLSESHLASIRMRAGLVGKCALDIQVELTAGDLINTKADVIVVGKIGVDCQNGRASLWIEQISQANKQSKKIILDYTDHHLESSSSTMGVFYKNILPFIDKAVVPSTRISHSLMQFLDKEVTVIEDPIEIQITPPKNLPPSDEMTLLWFGHATNTSYLVNYLQNDLLCDVDFRLIVLSNGPGLEMLASRQQRIRSTIKLDLAEWSLQNMINASLVSHGCLIPSDLNDSRKAGASSNRLITAFALGLPVSADVLESYSPFSDYFHNIRDTPLSEFNKQLASYAKKLSLPKRMLYPCLAKEFLRKNGKVFFNQQRRVEEL